MKLSELRPHLLYQFKSDDELVRAIEEVSHKFTRERENISDYLHDERLVSAYTAFYLLTNIPKLAAVMKWMPAGWQDVLKACDFVDLGAGPGTFSLAWREWENTTGDVYQVEKSELMRLQGKRIWEGLSEKKLIQGTDWNWSSDKPRFVLFGHSANEMGPLAALKYIEKINPDHILFIEPGTKDFFPKMLEIRRKLIASGYQVLFPCPQQDECPMHGSDQDWCHQFIQVRQDLEVERISQMVRLDRKLLPLTVQAFSRTFPASNPRERIVRTFDETKFSFEWEICHDNNIELYQVMKRDLSKKETKEVGLLLAGDAVETEVVKTLESSKRVKLKSY